MIVLVPPGPLMFCICLLYEVMTERQFYKNMSKQIILF